MTGRAEILAKMHLMLDTPGGDVTHAAELYHDDAVLEFPQSGERFEGRDTFTEWRSKYPQGVGVDVRHLTVREDLAIGEATVEYEDGLRGFGISVHEFRDGKIAYERIYFGEPWDPPQWRAPWRSDPATETGLETR